MPQRGVMRHDELSMIIQFSPVSLVVLDRNRCLKRVNKLAEAILGIDTQQCNGSQFMNWIAESSRPVFARALNHAADSKWSESVTGAAWAQPGSASVAMHTRRTATDKPGPPFWVEISCSAFFQTGQGGGETEANGFVHEAEFIINIKPMIGAHTRSAAVSSTESLLDPASSEDDISETSEFGRQYIPCSDLLNEAVMYNFEFPLIALSSDGRTMVRNAAMDTFLARIAELPEALDDFGHLDYDLSPESQSRGDIDVQWLFKHFKLWDPSFKRPLPESEYPLYKSAIRGLRFQHELFGVKAREGRHLVVDAEGWPLYDSEGKGNYIGGMLRLTDVTRQWNAGVHTLGQEPSTVLSAAEQQKLADHDEMLDREAEHTANTYKALLNDVPEIAWITSADGYLEWFSKNWYSFTGMTKEQSLGGGWTDAVHPDDMVSVSRIWSRALRTETRYEVQERIRAKDGCYRWMLGRAHPFRDEHGKVVRWFGMLTDIHSTLTTLAANRESKSNLTAAVRGANITLWSVNNDGDFTLAEGSLAGLNPLASTSSQSLSGGSDDHRSEMVRNSSIEKAPIVGKNIFKEWGESWRVPIEQALSGVDVVEESTIKGRTFRTELRPRRQRMSAPTSFLLSHEDDAARVIGVTGMSFDITDRLAMEKKFEESVREIAKAEAANNAAQEASRMKSEFLAIVSHEIRTPLNGVVGLSELLLDIESLPREAIDLVNSILRSSGALLTVINDVLDFSKVEAGKLDLVSLPFSPRLVCEDSIRDYQKLMRQKGLELQSDVQLEDEEVFGDAGRITQVINNLLGNASKFTEAGSITFFAGKSKEDLHNITYTFKVTDTGCGIPDNQRAFLFQPFRQGDPSTSRKYGGSGLGLAICRNLIVDLMGGQISLESQEGVGTSVTFSVSFPRVTGHFGHSNLHGTAFGGVPDGAALASSTTFPPSHIDLPPHEFLGLRRSSLATQSTARPRILLAEDNPVNSQIALKTLEKLGYDVDHVENGQQALEAFVNNPTANYALVLMDCMMPLMDGYEATRRMRASNSPIQRRIPVIALTAAAIKGKELCLSAGMTDYLSKPVRRATLNAMLRKWVGRQHDETSMLTPASETATEIPTPFDTVRATPSITSAQSAAGVTSSAFDAGFSMALGGNNVSSTSTTAPPAQVASSGDLSPSQAPSLPRTQASPPSNFPGTIPSFGNFQMRNPNTMDTSSSPSKGPLYHSHSRQQEDEDDNQDAQSPLGGQDFSKAIEKLNMAP